MSALLTQCPCGTVQTGTGKVDPARKLKCTTAAREHLIEIKVVAIISFLIYTGPPLDILRLLPLISFLYFKHHYYISKVLKLIKMFRFPARNIHHYQKWSHLQL